MFAHCRDRGTRKVGKNAMIIVLDIHVLIPQRVQVLHRLGAHDLLS